MKKLIIVFALFLSACANVALTSFDSTEYDKYIHLSNLANTMSESCDKPMQDNLQVLTFAVSSARLYTETKGSPNSRIASAAREVNDMLLELKSRYNSSTPPSAIYCKVKLTLISLSSLNIASSLAKKEN